MGIIKSKEVSEMNKTMTIVVVGVVALLIGAYSGYAYEKAKLMTMMETQRMDMQHQIDQAKMMEEKSDDSMMDPTGAMEDDKMMVSPTDSMIKK
jgi:hypothetical protein